MNTNELFTFLTSTKDWHLGYCAESTARVLKHRHEKGKLSEKKYRNLFEFFGYRLIQEVKWQKDAIQEQPKS